MKKTYIIPEALIVQFGTCKMMATSDPDVDVDKNGSVDAEGVDVKVITDTKLWDDLW